MIAYLELELSTIVEVFSRFNVGVEAGVGVGVESLSGVDERNIGHVSGGVNSNLKNEIGLIIDLKRRLICN